MIRPGDAYGEKSSVPDNAIEVGSDAEASRCLALARRSGRSLPPLLLRGGDLHRTLGGAVRSDSAAAPQTTIGVRAPVDLGILTTDTEEWLFVAHAVLRRVLWSGEFVVAMNAQWCGDLDLGPRSHPGDGLLDLTEGRLGIRQRLSARSRARSGSHLPHPQLRTRRVSESVVMRNHPLAVHIDGVRRAMVSTATLRVIPQAFIAYL